MWDVSTESQWMQHQMHMVYELDTPGMQRNDTWPRKGTQERNATLLSVESAGNPVKRR